MIIRIHADDFGLTKGITDRIMEAHTLGLLHSTSVIANGVGFNYAVELIKKNPNLKISIHLNFVEGKPISNPQNIPYLINKLGYFNKSFLRLSLGYYFSGVEKKKSIEKQIGLEMQAQIKKIYDSGIEDRVFQIDSHQHFHLMPFILKILSDKFSNQNQISVRMASEKFYITENFIYSLKNIFSPNLIKHFLLNFLSKRGKKYLKSKMISYNDYLIGVLYTGNMSIPSIKKPLELLMKKKSSLQMEIEILLHPGSADLNELELWEGNMSQSTYYFDKCRQSELQTLKDPQLKNIVTKYS